MAVFFKHQYEQLSWAFLLVVPALTWAMQQPQYEQLRGVSEYAFGAIVKTPRAYFYSDGGGCPKETATCRRKAYLVRGDVVVISDAGGNEPFVRGFYAANGDTPAVSGWLRRAELDVVEMATEIPVMTWLGHYFATPFKRGNEALSAELQISVAKDGKLHIKGESVPTQDGVAIKGLPSASIDTSLIPTSKGAITATASAQPKGSCDLSLALIGPYLAVDASGTECSGEGGLRATFQGLYVRSGAKTNALMATTASTPAQASMSSGGVTAHDKRANTSAGPFTLHSGMRMSGGNTYKTLSGAIVTLDGCRADCTADSQCLAFEFRSGVPNQSHPFCALMKTPGTLQAAPGYTSGLRK